LLAAMRKIVMEDDLSYGLTPVGLRNADGFYDVEAVGAFVRDNMERVGQMAWAQQLQRAQGSMRMKACSKKVEEAVGGQLN
jgi:hypothetical protein